MDNEIIETIAEEEQSTALAVSPRARPELPALKLDGPTFLMEYSPVKIQEKYSKVSTALQASAADIPSLLDLDKTYGRDYVLGYVKLWLINLADFLDLKQPTDQQLTLSASTIYDKNKTLNLADLKVVTESILSGDVPLTAVRSDKVCPLLAKYWQRRCTENQEHHDAQQKIITLNPLDEETLLQGYKDDLKARMAATEEERAKKERELDAIRAKCRVADAIIKRNQQRAKEGAKQ